MTTSLRFSARNLWLLITAAGIAPFATAATDHPVASTSAGSVRGYVDNGINVFKGIPYGDDTARHRFMAPVPPAHWEGVKDALDFGPMAPQPYKPKTDKTDFVPMPKEGTIVSEDCLHLNVWTGGLHDGKTRPVMVWFHGGGYNGWSTNVDLYDGVRLCKRGDVVVVTVNHRLNGFGFLYLAELGGPEFADSGNAGMLDLVLALKWIHENIAEFGGDPGRVLIYGQSGGGAKCATLMAMPAAHGLFNRVATMSGQQLTGRTREHGTETAKSVLAKLNLTPERLAEIKTLPMEKLIEAMKGETYAPVVDGRSLPRDPFAPDASPLSSDIPMILGNTHDETTYLIGGTDPSLFTLSWDSLPGKLSQSVGQFMGGLDLGKVIAQYREWHPEYSPGEVFFAVTTASRSWKGMVMESERRATYAKAPTYIYEFDWKTPVYNGTWKAPHTLDIPFSFDNLALSPTMVGKDAVAKAQRLADIMSDTFIAFARTGNPNNPSLPEWPRFELTHRPTMIFDLPTRVENDPRGAERKLFAPVEYIQPGT